jgi:hypothetical protein
VIVSAAEPSEQVPDQVAVQDSPAVQILLLGEEAGECLFEADEFLVALGQGADSDQGEAQMLEDWAFRQLVECFVSQRHSSGCEVRQDRDGGLFGEPPVGGDGVFGGGDLVP